MNITIFGTTGNIGRRLSEQALGEGHDVTAFTRDAARVTVEPDRLQAVEGDVTDVTYPLRHDKFYRKHHRHHPDLGDSTTTDKWDDDDRTTCRPVAPEPRVGDGRQPSRRDCGIASRRRRAPHRDRVPCAHRAGQEHVDDALGLTEDRAFRVLSRWSALHNVKLRVIAIALVNMCVSDPDLATQDLDPKRLVHEALHKRLSPLVGGSLPASWWRRSALAVLRLARRPPHVALPGTLRVLRQQSGSSQPGYQSPSPRTSTLDGV